MIECKFSLDLTKNGIQKTVYAKAGEQNARKLIVTLTHSGCVFVLASQEKTYSAKVFLETGENFEAEVVGNTVQAVIPNAFPEPQIRVCELRVSHGNEVIFSPMFELIIEESLGNKSVSESLQSGIAFQESLSNSEIQDEEMLDSDYVVVYDSSKSKATRLPWSKINERFEGFLKNHNDLEGRDAENQHPIISVSGLQDALDSKTTEMEAAKTNLINTINSTKETLEKSISNEAMYRESAINFAQNERNRIEITMDGYVDDIYDQIEQLRNSGSMGMTSEQVEKLNEAYKDKHSHNNKSVLDNLDEENGVLTYNGNTIGGSGSAGRPTAEYVYDYHNDYRMINDGNSTMTLYIMCEEATDEEKAIVGKEIADIEFERSTGERVSLKNVSEVDFLPCFSMLNHIVTATIGGTESVAFVSLYFPTPNWLKTEITNNILSKIRITYYTD